MCVCANTVILVCQVYIDFHCRKQEKVLMNVEGGYILRSKPVNTTEVGINAGFGSLDLPTLVE